MLSYKGNIWSDIRGHEEKLYMSKNGLSYRKNLWGNLKRNTFFIDNKRDFCYCQLYKDNMEIKWCGHEGTLESVEAIFAQSGK